MANTITPNVVTSGAAGQIDYPMEKGIGLPGLLADLSLHSIISGSNETGLTIAYGVPVVRNNGGVLPNSFVMATAAGAMLGLLVRTNTHEKEGRPAINEIANYEEGVPDLKEGNVLTQGRIYIQCMESVGVGNPTLRFHKSGANAGKWGTAASAGNTIALPTTAGWTIRKAGSATQLAILEINTPANIVLTADT
jgi:hypothetical protein